MHKFCSWKTGEIVKWNFDLQTDFGMKYVWLLWMQIKPDVSTVCFGIAASQGALLLAGGKKGKRFAMPNARIMIHQPQGGCGVLLLTTLLSWCLLIMKTTVWALISVHRLLLISSVCWLLLLHFSVVVLTHWCVSIFDDTFALDLDSISSNIGHLLCHLYWTLTMFFSVCWLKGNRWWC